MNEGFQERWEENNVKINPILIMWELHNRIKEIDEITKDDEVWYKWYSEVEGDEMLEEEV